MGSTSKVVLWLKASRALYSLTVLLPCCVGALIAWQAGFPFRPDLLALIVVGMLFSNIGTNFTNDYFDYRSGVDRIDEGRKFKPGAEVILDAAPAGGPPPHSTSFFSPRTILASALCCFGATIAVGLVLAAWIDWWILPFGIVGVAFGWFYTAPPLKFGYRGLGDLICFLGSGPLPVTGTYFLFAGSVSPAALLAGCFVGILVDAILYIGNVPDAEADRQVGKRTLSTMLGKGAVRVLAPVYYLAAFAILAIAVLLAAFPPWTLLAFAALPLALRIMTVTRRTYDDTPNFAPAIMMTVRAFAIATILLGSGFALDRLLR
jgi:1,4-dihydroxy-2-naphthoate octaprenyltransferase